RRAHSALLEALRVGRKGQQRHDRRKDDWKSDCFRSAGHVSPLARDASIEPQSLRTRQPFFSAANGALNEGNSTQAPNVTQKCKYYCLLIPSYKKNGILLLHRDGGYLYVESERCRNALCAP